MRRIALVLILSCVLCSPCYADSDNYIDNQKLENSLPEYALDILGGNGSSTTDDVDGMSQRIIYALKTEIQKIYKPSLRRGVFLIAIAFICSVLDVFGYTNNPLYVKLCGCAAVSLVCAGEMGSYIKLGQDTLASISEFSNAMLPALCTAGIVCGTPVSSAAKYAASSMFIDILVNTASNIILPMILVYTALIIASAAFGNKALTGVCNLLKWACISLMTALTLIFVIYISISSVISTSGEAAASKVAKTTISTVLPVVGGIISDAASAVIAGAELIRSVTGVFGLFAVLAICVVPFAALGVNYLVMKASAAMINTFCSDGIGNLVKGFGTSLGMILALTGSAGIMLFISITSCIRAVGA